MANVSSYSTTAASNNSSPPDGAPEGMAANTVNDVIREEMAALARWYSDTDGSLTSTGSSNAYVLTSNSSHAALADQSILVFKANHANTGAATLNVDSLGAKAIKKNHDVALASGDIEANQIVVVAYNATDDAYELISNPILGTAAEVDTGTSATNVPLNSDGSGIQSLNADNIASGTVATARLPSASDTAKGVVELATTAETQTGTDTERAVTPSGVKNSIGISKTFESSEQTVSTSSKTDVAHGLGAVPKLVFAVLRCKTAERNYSVGDEIVIDSDAGNNRQISIAADSTNVSISTGPSNYQITDKNGGSIAAITNANWRIVVRAWA